jgi:hypothetical protein
MSKYCIGYLDDDPGQTVEFMNKFENYFEIKEIEMEKISAPPDIINEIIKNELELIVLDFMLNAKGKYFNADEIVKEIDKWNPYFPRLIITTHETEAFDQLDDVNIINIKNSLEQRTKNGSNLFVLRVEKNINQYKYKKEEAVKKLEELVDKKGKTGLSPAEEEEYFNNYRFLNDIEPLEKLLPSHLLTPQSVSSLHDLLISAQDILKQLKEEK